MSGSGEHIGTGNFYTNFGIVDEADRQRLAIFGRMARSPCDSMDLLFSIRSFRSLILSDEVS